MSSRHTLIGIIAITCLLIGNGCKKLPDSGPLSIDLFWEIPVSQKGNASDAGESDAAEPDAGESDAAEPDASESDAEKTASGTYGECEKAGVASFYYSLRDMADCDRTSKGWRCNVVESIDEEDAVTCNDVMNIARKNIRGGDYMLYIYGLDAKGVTRWEVSCEDLRVDGKKTPFYTCDIPYNPNAEE
jgi:hypothetical protein